MINHFFTITIQSWYNLLFCAYTVNTFYSYLTLSEQLHLHKRVHLKSAPLHVHLDVLHVALQAHLINSLHSLLASDWLIQYGIHFMIELSLSFHQKSLGNGRFCRTSRHLLQTTLWKRARLVWKSKAFLVGGIFSMFWVLEKYIFILASFTNVKIDVQLYMIFKEGWRMHKTA